MSLMQISDPDAEKEKQPLYARALGIDLGTTHSLAATVQRHDNQETVQLIEDQHAATIIPSVVHYLADGRVVVGAEAAAMAAEDPANIIFSSKRLIGHSYDEVKAMTKDLPYRLSADSGVPRLHTRAGAKTPVEVAAEILKALRRNAEQFLHEDNIDAAVITVPAYFDDAQRQATKDAARLAGLKVLRLLNEPTAAALAYGINQHQRSQTIAVYDLGGGTFDISILKLERGVFQVLATGGDTALGGDDIDRLLANFFIHQAGGHKDQLSATNADVGTVGGDQAGGHKDQLSATNADVGTVGGDQAGDRKDQLSATNADVGTVSGDQASGRKDQLSATAFSLLLAVAKQCKEALSTDQVFEQSFQPTTHAPAWSLRLSRTQLNELIQPLIERSVRVCRRVFHDANLQPAEIDELILVGGSTRIAYLRERVAKLFKRQPLHGIDPDKVVAIGAAIQADNLIGNKSNRTDMLLLDVVPLSLGIETMGGLVECLVPRNTTVPVSRAQEFTTYQDGQTAMSIHVVQGERELVDDCRSLARFDLRGIPPMTAGAARIVVSLRVDADGLLTVAAEEKTRQVKASVEVQPTYGLKNEDVEKMLRDSVHYSRADRDQRRLKEQQVEAQRAITALTAALQTDGKELLNEHEYQGLIQAQERLQATLNSNDPQRIRAQLEALEKCSEDYVKRRINRHLDAVICGRSVNEL